MSRRLNNERDRPRKGDMMGRFAMEYPFLAFCMFLATLYALVEIAKAIFN